MCCVQVGCLVVVGGRVLVLPSMLVRVVVSVKVGVLVIVSASENA